MYCPICRHLLPDGANYCPNCGNKVASSSVSERIKEALLNELCFNHKSVDILLCRSLTGVARTGAYCKSMNDSYILTDSFADDAPYCDEIQDVYINDFLYCSCRRGQKWAWYSSDMRYGYKMEKQGLEFKYDSVHFHCFQDKNPKTATVYFECVYQGKVGIISAVTGEILVPFGKYDEVFIYRDHSYGYKKYPNGKYVSDFWNKDNHIVYEERSDISTMDKAWHTDIEFNFNS